MEVQTVDLVHPIILADGFAQTAHETSVVSNYTQYECSYIDQSVCTSVNVIDALVGPSLDVDYMCFESDFVSEKLLKIKKEQFEMKIQERDLLSKIENMQLDLVQKNEEVKSGKRNVKRFSE